MKWYGYYRGWYSQLNGIIVNIVLRDIALHFQGQTVLLCICFIKKIAQAAGVPRRFASIRTAPAVELPLFANLQVIRFDIQPRNHQWCSRWHWSSIYGESFESATFRKFIHIYISQSMTTALPVIGKSYMNFLTAYLHLSLAHFNGDGWALAYFDSDILEMTTDWVQSKIAVKQQVVYFCWHIYIMSLVF